MRRPQAWRGRHERPPYRRQSRPCPFRRVSRLCSGGPRCGVPGARSGSGFHRLYQALRRNDGRRPRQPCRARGAFDCTGEAETLDLYPAGEGAPLFVYIHGGYWRLLGREDSGFMAPAFVQAGCAVAALNYGLAPAVTLDEIVRQCRAAVAWLWREAERFGIDHRRILVGGSSAGGHLTGMLLARGWQADFGLPEDAVAGGMAASGLFDLEPIRLSEINGWMNLDAEAARRNSPLFHVPEDAGTPLVLTVGGHEQGEFKRQTAEYAGAWRAAGNPVHEVPAPDRHHFDVVLDLADPSSALFEATMRMTGR
ncbi:alpha/beta hydrolase [Caenispirillum salinarum]|uniref:alpha/beta hydrolase n=1 Tax=Caenispirillum salinarum TaxID=859058 RepID=UPI00384ADB3A